MLSGEAMGLESATPAPFEEGPAEEAVDDLLGQVIGGTYRIVRVIGEGGTGRVYEAHHTRIPSKRFAIKVLHPEFLRHPEAWVRFQREAEAAGSIDHPNVVDVYDVNRTKDGRPYVVFAYLEGIELGELLESRGALPPRLAASIVQEVCRGLAAAHERGVVHRDIKPQNIWLMGDLEAPTVKILDFGLSRLADEATSVTKTGVLLGTPVYMSPEQARGERADSLADIYGAGTILYATLTGRPPFEEENVQRTLIAVMSAEPPRPRSVVATIPEGLEMVVQRAMAKEPEDRYPNALSLERALDRYASPPTSIRPPAASFALIPAANEDQASRSMLVVYLLASFVFVLALLASALVGVISLTGGLSARELALALLALLGTVLTPAYLALRHVRANVWDNGVKVQELRRRLRKVVVTGAAAYGLTALTLRIIDTLVARFVPEGPLGAIGGPGWVPLNTAYALVALVGVVVAWTMDRRVMAERHGWRLLLVALVVLVGGFVVYGSVRLRAQSLATAHLETRLTQMEGLRGADAAALARESARVGPDELASAVAHGREALEKMREAYPRDPAVLQALALAQGRRPESYGEAMTTVASLFELDDEYTQDRALRVLVSKAAQYPDSREPALALLVTSMGSGGLDLLYDLMNRSKSLRPKILTMFESAEIRERFSPALAIAYDLRVAPDCASRLPLLDRAARLGDERTIAVLAPLSERTKTGCGRWKNMPCKAPCEAQAKEFQGVVRQIQERLKE